MCSAEELVRPRGFEPLTFCSGGKRSIQLSYGRAFLHSIAQSGAPAHAKIETVERPVASRGEVAELSKAAVC